jgi:hypothetical protein
MLGSENSLGPPTDTVSYDTRRLGQSIAKTLVVTAATSIASTPFMSVEDEEVAAEMAKHNVAAEMSVINTLDPKMR